MINFCIVGIAYFPVAAGSPGPFDKNIPSGLRLKISLAIVLHDTNILSTIVYADYYFGGALDWATSILPERGYSLYLLCSPDIPWVADPGQRASSNARTSLHQLFTARIKKYGLPYQQISGSHENRLSQAIQAIDCC